MFLAYACFILGFISGIETTVLLQSFVAMDWKWMKLREEKTNRNGVMMQIHDANLFMMQIYLG